MFWNGGASSGPGPPLAVDPAPQGAHRQIPALDQGGAEGGLAGGQAEQVGGDPHLTITAVSGADADDGNHQFGPEGGRQARRHMFEDQGEASLVLQGQGLAPESLLADGILRLAAIAEAMHRLGGEAQMAHDGDARPHGPVNHGQGFRFGPFQFDGGGRCLLEHPASGGEGVIEAALIAEKRQIADQQRRVAPLQRQAPAGGPAVVQHFVQGHRQGGGVAQHHHGQRIAHQDRIGTGLGHQGRRERIPGREDGDGPTQLFPRQPIPGALGHGGSPEPLHC